jgi:hypothetical protein
MTPVRTVAQVAILPETVAGPVDDLESASSYSPIASWEIACAGLAFGALCFLGLYFTWFLWTGTLLI